MWNCKLSPCWALMIIVQKYMYILKVYIYLKGGLAFLFSLYSFHFGNLLKFIFSATHKNILLLFITINIQYIARNSFMRPNITVKILKPTMKRQHHHVWLSDYFKTDLSTRKELRSQLKGKTVSDMTFSCWMTKNSVSN